MNLQNKLTENYVAYLDVLGFKELVYKDKISQLETYFSTIKETLEVLRHDKKSIDSILISDSIVLISPDSNDDFKILLRAIQTIQARLALKNIWLRGAVSFGEIYFEKESSLVVGKGLVNAYLLEQEAKFPRVIIDPIILSKKLSTNRIEFYEFANPNSENFKTDKLKLVHTWFNHIPDDSFFITYAYKIILNAVSQNNLDIIYNYIKDRLYSDQKYYEKYLWVKNYFSDTIDDLFKKYEYHAIHKHEKDFNGPRNYLEEWYQKFLEL
jgi:hypothetical protein